MTAKIKWVSSVLCFDLKKILKGVNSTASKHKEWAKIFINSTSVSTLIAYFLWGWHLANSSLVYLYFKLQPYVPFCCHLDPLSKTYRIERERSYRRLCPQLKIKKNLVRKGDFKFEEEELLKLLILGKKKNLLWFQQDFNHLR